jgi:hypothetical protein
MNRVPSLDNELVELTGGTVLDQDHLVNSIHRFGKFLDWEREENNRGDYSKTEYLGDLIADPPWRTPAE